MNLESIYNNFRVPENWPRLLTIDAHTEGEPLRIIFAGMGPLEGDTILERRRSALADYDHLRKALMWEPRGHADMYGCLVVPPVTPEAHFGVFFLHNQGYSTMCGHAIIAMTKMAVELGLVQRDGDCTTVVIDSPAGQVTGYAHWDGSRVTHVSFDNVPSFVQALDATVDVPGLGTIKYDLAFGGAFYAYVDVAQVGLRCEPEDQQALIQKGMAIKQAVMASTKMGHPFEEELNYLYGTIFIGPPKSGDTHSSNVCIFADGQVDRCPTGTGVSGRAAIHHARGQIGVGDSITIESIIKSRFDVAVMEETTFGPYKAIIPRVSGRAFITGKHEFTIDPNDPLAEGFFLR